MKIFSLERLPVRGAILFVAAACALIVSWWLLSQPRSHEEVRAQVLPPTLADAAPTNATQQAVGPLGTVDALPKIVLLGTALGPPGEHIVILSVDGALGHAYRVGDEVAPGITVHAATATHVVVRTPTGFVEARLAAARTTQAETSSATTEMATDLDHPDSAKVVADSGARVSFGAPPPPDQSDSDEPRPPAVSDDGTSAHFGPLPPVSQDTE